MDIEIARSSRHAHISGNFGESLILYILSKYGFECARVDHTGIDIIARNPNDRQLMGISVKCRTRVPGREKVSVTIHKTELKNVDDACSAFECKPFFAIVVDANGLIRVFITAKEDFIRLATKKGNCYWGMSDSFLEQYRNDENVFCFELDTKMIRWWNTKPA